MALLNNNFFSINGESVTGRVPAQINNMTPDVELSEGQRGTIARAYKVFCDAVRVSLPGFHVQHRTYIGMKLRLESSNGVDRVFVWLEGGGIEDQEDALYVDSGDLQVVYPAPESPTRLDPAKLKFMDISILPTVRWLGEVYIAVFSLPQKRLLGLASRKFKALRGKLLPNVIPLGTQTHWQRTKRPMVENMDSFAIGYKPTKTAEDLQNEKDKWGGRLVEKKLVMGLFPASLWTGKMRLFMQAQYGAPAWVKHWHFALNVVGLDVVLDYTYYNNNGVEHTLRLGLLDSASPGIFSASDGSFWLINITFMPTGYSAAAYPLVPVGNTAKALAAAYMKYKQGQFVPEFYATGVTSYQALSADEETRIETYILGYSEIRVDKGYVIGTYATGVSGDALYYGWKFNSTGTKASIIVHQVEGSYGNVHLQSYTHHLNISYTPVSGQEPSQSWFSVAGNTTNNGSWLDGWGNYNIFVPESSIGGRLVCWSLRMDYWPSGTSALAPSITFSNVPVYGYYKDDAWTTCTMTSTSVDPDPEIEFSPYGMYWQDVYNTGEVDSVDNASYLSGNNWGYQHHSISETDNMSIAFDGLSFSGKRKYGSYTSFSVTFGEQGPDTWNDPAYPNDQHASINSSYGTPGVTIWSSSYSVFASKPEGYWVAAGSGTAFAGVRHVTASNVTETYTAHDVKAWVMVVPCFDAEALYISTYSYIDYHDDYTKHTVVVGNGRESTCFVAHSVGPNGDGGSMDVYTYQACNNPLPLPPSQVLSDTTDTEPPSPITPADVHCFNQVVSNQTGTPAHGYSSLYQVSYTYPYYDPGMYMVTSSGKRYWGSEGVQSPASLALTGSPNFVGWA